MIKKVRIILTCAAALAMLSATTALATQASTSEPEGGASEAQCSERPYLVFFDVDLTDITPAGQATLDQAIAAYPSCDSTRIMLVGETDRTAGARYCCKISMMREKAVRLYLESQGIPPSAFASASYGSPDPLASKSEESPKDRPKHIEIVYGPGSGI